MTISKRFIGKMALLGSRLMVPVTATSTANLLSASSICKYTKICRRQAHSSPKSESLTADYDVIIVGGGLVGTAMACALGCSKILAEKSVLLLEGAPEKPYVMRSNYSNRVSAINTSSVGLFKDIGVWSEIESKRVRKVKKMQVWDSSSTTAITFNNDDFNEPLAYIIENDLIQSALTSSLKNASNVTVRYNSQILDAKIPRRNDSIPSVVLEGGDSLKCNLLIGADGANSKIRSHMRTTFTVSSYNQFGVVATLRLSEPTDNVVAWQRFLPDGPIALLPLSDEVSSLVWSTNPTHARELLSMPKESFIAAINEAFVKEYPVNSCVQSLTNGLNYIFTALDRTPSDIRQLPPAVGYVDEGSRAAFPLAVGIASRYLDSCSVLIGDAAHRVHPLAGQGVNLGFGDVHCLAHLLEAAVYNGAHIGWGKHMHIYEGEREANNTFRLGGIHFLHKLYQSKFTPFVALRSLGIQMVHSSPAVKKKIMEIANR